MKKIIQFFTFLLVFLLWFSYIYLNDENINLKVNSFLYEKFWITKDELSFIIELNKTIWTFSNNIKTKENLNLSWNYTIEKIIELKWEKNEINDSFSKSKINLMNLYKDKKIESNTMYCNCSFNSLKNVNYNNCDFESNWKYENRLNKIEFEHIVPAENFWQSFIEWREGNKDCIDSKWKEFKGRNCASKTNKEYRYMEADIYNLTPVVWTINALRSNYQISEIPWEEREFWKCDLEIKDRKFEPRDEIKWDIARIYLYMDKTYPWKWIISNKNEKLIEVWNSMDPISQEECEIYIEKKEIQKNKNLILDLECSKIIK